MKKQVIQSTIVVAVCLWLTGGLVYSQSLPKLVADIPFDFHVGQAMLPAGEYIVNKSEGALSHVLRIQNAITGKAAFASTLPGSITNSSSQPKLIFNRYGADYFLSEVRSPYQSVTYRLPKSKDEKEIARNGIGVKSEVVAQKR